MGARVAQRWGAVGASMPPLNLAFLTKVRVAFCPFFNVSACRCAPAPGLAPCPHTRRTHAACTRCPAGAVNPQRASPAPASAQTLRCGQWAVRARCGAASRRATRAAAPRRQRRRAR